MKKITNLKNFSLDVNQKVLKAMEKLNNKEVSFLIIVDQDMTLLGTLTDGDIRRHILKGKSLNEKVKIAMNSKPIFSYDSDKKNHKNKLLSSQSILKFLPVINKIKKVEFILVHEKEEMNNIALIMAGGYGKRLGSKTKRTPKPLLKVGNKTILDIIIRKIKNAGLKKIFVSTHYLHEKILTHIQTKYNRFDISIINEEFPMGTAGCISMINENNNYKNLLVINGDVVSNVDIKSLISYHHDTKNDITLTIARYSYQIPFGLVELNKNYRLINIKEKPSIDYNVVSGIYCLKKNICNLVSKEYIDMTTLISNSIQMKKKIGVFPIHEYWTDIGNPDDLIRAKKEYNK